VCRWRPTQLWSPFPPETLLFQWPSIRWCASRVMVERKTPESNKSALPNTFCPLSAQILSWRLALSSIAGVHFCRFRDLHCRCTPQLPGTNPTSLLSGAISLAETVLRPFQ
jgi:hypothetical protein